MGDYAGFIMLPRRHLLAVASLAFLSITSSCHSSSNSKRLLLTLECNTGELTNTTHVAYSADGKLLASCYREDGSHSDTPGLPPSGIPKEFDARREVKVWDAFTGKELWSIEKGKITNAIGFFPNNQDLAVAVGNTARIWDTTTGKEKLALKGHADVIRDLDISPDGKWLATASLDGTIKVWDVQTAGCLHTLKGHPEGVLYVSFSPDGKRVVGSGGDRDREGEIRMWDWEADKQVLSLPHDALFGKALFSPDGKHLACHRTGVYKAWKPGLVEVWNYLSRELVFSRELPSEEVECIAYSPDGAFLANGLDNSTIIVINSLTGDETPKLAPPGYVGEHHRPVEGIAFSPSGDRLAAAYRDGTVRIWGIEKRGEK